MKNIKYLQDEEDKQLTKILVSQNMGDIRDLILPGSVIHRTTLEEEINNEVLLFFQANINNVSEFDDVPYHYWIKYSEEITQIKKKN